MTRVVVTGAAGFIGSHTVESFARDGWDVTAVDDLSGGTDPLLLQEWWQGLGVEFMGCSVAEMGPAPADVYVHLASPVGPVGVLRAPGRIAQRILDDALTVAEFAKADNALMVFVSTSELYGPQDGPSDETAQPTFIVPASARQEYAAGKLTAEIALLNTPGLRVRIIRPFNVAGARQRAGGGFVIPRWITQSRAGLPITVYGNGTQRRAFCDVRDFVDGLRRVVDVGRDGERYNLGNPDNACTLNDLAALFVHEDGPFAGTEIVHVDPTTLHGPEFREAPDKTPVANKAKAELGWCPTRSNVDIIVDAQAA